MTIMTRSRRDRAELEMRLENLPDGFVDSGGAVGTASATTRSVSLNVSYLSPARCAPVFPSARIHPVRSARSVVRVPRQSIAPFQTNRVCRHRAEAGRGRERAPISRARSPSNRRPCLPFHALHSISCFLHLRACLLPMNEPNLLLHAVHSSIPRTLIYLLDRSHLRIARTRLGAIYPTAISLCVSPPTPPRDAHYPSPTELLHPKSLRKRTHPGTPLCTSGARHGTPLRDSHSPTSVFHHFTLENNSQPRSSCSRSVLDAISITTGRGMLL